MKTVLAALAGSPADAPVLGAARSLGEMLAADVAAIHVEVKGADVRDLGDVPLRRVSGDVVEELAGAGLGEEVVALVLGARRLPADPRPLGATAEAVATRVAKPVLIVPPETQPTSIRRVLVPLEGTLESSHAPRHLFELAGDVAFEVVALHVLGTEAIPAFTDQPQHERPAWEREFLARYCPSGIGDVRLETRVGSAENIVPLVAEECGCDLIAMGWAQELAPGRAPVVRSALLQSGRPVLLVPVGAAARVPAGLGAGTAAG
ncbi:MAG TPA: universal stress protein [Gaiellaceae bacterium]|nr:universal stress protein [Gaiellaceae bacterium]